MEDDGAHGSSERRRVRCLGGSESEERVAGQDGGCWWSVVGNRGRGGVSAGSQESGAGGASEVACTGQGNDVERGELRCSGDGAGRGEEGR